MTFYILNRVLPMERERPALNNWPSGHVHHLTEDQEESLRAFKALCQTKGCYTPSVNGSQASHDDETMLRFLRARSFVPTEALSQFKDTEEWRREQDIEQWYRTIDVAEYETTRKLYTHWTGRRDKNGLPLYVFRIGAIDENAMTDDAAPKNHEDQNVKISNKLRRLFATYEHLTTFVFPLCSMISSRPHPETPISQCTCIVDIQGIGLRQFWRLKKHLQDASALATAHYPETLGVTFIVGAPSFFSTIWSWIKKWFDPGTVAKICILSHPQVKSTLELYVDSDSIPKRYGGTLDWDFGQLPVLEPAITDLLGWESGSRTIPTGPISLIWNDKETGLEAHALGSVDGVQRDDVIASVGVGTKFLQSFKEGS